MGALNAFSLFFTGFVVVLVVVLLRTLIYGSDSKVTHNGSMICPHCGTRGDPIKVTKGSILIELFLWLLFIIPGLIYTLWRLTSSYTACPSCKQPGMISVESPTGRAILKNIQMKDEKTAGH